MTDTFTAAVIPAKAGIQAIDNIPTRWPNTPDTVLTAAQSYITSWIPAFAGMTELWVLHTVAFVPNVVLNYVKLNDI